MSRDHGKADFDEYADAYRDLMDATVGSSGFRASFFAERKAREISGTLSERGIRSEGIRLLNFGCGIGEGERALTLALPGASIYAVDISSRSIEIARERNQDLPGVRFSRFDGHRIPFPGPFDVILLAGVLHHIPPADRLETLREIGENLSSSGLLFVFEHNPWNPLTRKIVRDCPFDVEAELLSSRELRRLLRTAGYRTMHLRYIHFFPKLLAALIPAEHYLRSVPIGAQYYCTAVR